MGVDYGPDIVAMGINSSGQQVIIDKGSIRCGTISVCDRPFNGGEQSKVTLARLWRSRGAVAILKLGKL